MEGVIEKTDSANDPGATRRPTRPAGRLTLRERIAFALGAGFGLALGARLVIGARCALALVALAAACVDGADLGACHAPRLPDAGPHVATRRR